MEELFPGDAPENLWELEAEVLAQPSNYCLLFPRCCASLFRKRNCRKIGRQRKLKLIDAGTGGQLHPWTGACVGTALVFPSSHARRLPSP